MSITFDHIENEARRQDATRLAEIFAETTAWRPRLWSKTIGYGLYRYTYASGRSGEWFATGFAVRARDFSLHIMPGYSTFDDIAAQLGPYKRGKACWYIKRLSDIDDDALRALIRAGIEDLRTQWPVEPT